MSLPEAVPSGRIRLLSWSVLALTVAVVVGGALVRATDSGAGCGETWPICGGQIIPDIGSYHTLIEISHRLMTGLLGFGVISLFILVRRNYESTHRLRRAVLVAGILLVVESLLGASLVLFGWVEFDASIARLIVVPLHLTNTFMLVGAFAMVAYFASGGRGFRIDLSRTDDKLAVTGLGILLVIGATGALNALADTLIQSNALHHAEPGEFLITEPILRQIRSIHPFVAIVGGLVIYMLARYLAPGAGTVARWLAFTIQGIVWVQFILGLVNIALEVPLETQLLHLVVADVMWVTMILLCATVLGGFGRAEVAPSHTLVSEPV
jgi:cytochrome c oxidase assembly protein subunit 15